ncbi:paired amphipathic helix protein Sin3a-like isoform X3 [Colias croceus]|uniref:paired amphipathic helix protein Sin3a-like isoform X3 n=1 Tax=Colias crocea TaxID=72248 RepID=UPI001E27EAA2|nr:paired amphipathic helix protein Sin3a-like isoform X3 [Colias croceus]
MMKRTGPRLGPDEPTPMSQSPAQIQQAGASNMHTLAQSAQPQILGATAMLSVGGGFGRGPPRAGAPQVINYLKANAVQYAPPKQPQVPPRVKLVSQQTGLPLGGRQSPNPPPAGGASFQRLKVEDALSYLDQVKYKFNTQPQVYNDFLDIMKEFKSQTIDTPGVITRVSNLFKGHPELIVGFNTFLPPGYKIEVQSNGQVSVSMPSPSGLGAGVGGVGVGVVGGVVGVGVAHAQHAPAPPGASGVLLGVHHAPAQPQLLHLLPVQQSVSQVVHNLSVNPSPANTLHHISQAHQQIEAAAIQHHTSGGPPSTGSHATAAGQPVEFNHAIEYVNKIKSRFSRQPDKYKRFLEILHAYQRGHRDVKEPQAKQQTEQEVYSQVAKLFENQEDLLAEFGQFLPDAKAVTKPPHIPTHARSPPPPARVEPEPERFTSAASASPPLPQHPIHHPQVPKHTSASNVSAPPPQHHHLKRSPSFSSSTPISSGAPPAKKSRGCAVAAVGALRDVSYAEAAKLATAHEYNFFDRARQALRSPHVYENFLRCLLLFTNEIISSSELLCVVSPFLCRHPELQKWLQDFLGPVSPPHTPTAPNSGYNNTSGSSTLLGYERSRLGSESKSREPLGLPSALALSTPLRHDRPQTETNLDLDLSTCKRLGTSYCALPKEAASRRCSGRTALCKEVLNDTWVSIPTWSEDSTFVTSRKTQYEEYIYRCEDERFELDVVIETNAATIRVLEGVQKKLARMPADDAAKYRLDDCLGGHSPTIHQRALRRIYGDKVAVDIIAGLKKNPVVAVPVVLRRLKAKEEEWREAQKGFNKQWREQNEKYYLKSLDHQGINFKQNDLKAMRSKSLFNEVESAYAARRPGPHYIADYNMTSRQEAIKIVRDAAELLIHHARRQTAIQKAEKRRIKHLLRHFLPDLFSHPRQPLSDDERDDDKEEATSPGSPTAGQNDEKSSVKQEKQESSESDNASDKSTRNNKIDKENKPKNNNNTDTKDSTNPSIKRSSSNEDNVKSEMKNDMDIEDDYRDYPPNEGRFVCTSSWYLFLRLHAILCARLAGARRAALALAEAEAGAHRPPSVAAALRLKPNNLPTEVSSPAEYYNTLLELVKGVLDGNTEASAYEDAAREMFGIKAYPAYTLDKVVSTAVRQLQHCVSESWSVRAAEMAARGGMRGPLAYVHKAARYLRADHTTFLVRVYGGDECKVTFELLEPAGEGRTSPQLNNENSRLSPTNQCGRENGTTGAIMTAAAWSRYTERYARPDITTRCHKPVFLRRNARRTGGDSLTARAACAAPAAVHAAVGGGTGAGVAARRRKPPRLHDHSECTIANPIRFVACRPHQLYRAGCLSSARASHPRLSALRRERFRAWLASTQRPT